MINLKMFLNMQIHIFAKTSFSLFITAFLFISSGCSDKINYLKKGSFLKPNIWEKVEINNAKISSDQKNIFSENGTPTYILTFFEANSEGKKGRPVQEWVYEKEEKFFWFVNGNLVDYIAVSPPKEKLIRPPGM